MTFFRVVDIETTGTDPTDRVCEIGWTTVEHIPGTPEAPSNIPGVAWSAQPAFYRVRDTKSFLCNPEVPIGPEVCAVHHITDEMVEDAPGFTAVLDLMLYWGPLRLLLNEEMVLVAHNARFEQQWLTPSMVQHKRWICTYKCAMRVWPDAPAHSNGALSYWLSPEDLWRPYTQPAHRAGPDSYTTAFILVELLKRASLEDLVQWSTEPVLLKTVRFGKHSGELWEDVPYSYLTWCRGQDMDEDVLHTVKHHLRKRDDQNRHLGASAT